VSAQALGAVVLLGALAGMSSGLLGVGGGLLYVPALATVVGLGLVEAEATSLLAIVPTALAGALQQRRYGNLRLADGAVVGVLSLLGVVAGVELAHALPEPALVVLFEAVLLFCAYRLARRALARG
jgi:uncharacterized membrane protein YfcA